MRSLIPRYLVGLGPAGLTNAELHTVAAAVKLSAPTSTLVLAIPAMQASATAMDQKATALTKATAKVGDARTALRLAISDEAEARSELVGEVRTYVTLTSNNAKSPADIHDAGLPSAAPRPAHNTPPEVPQQIDNKPPKKGHGKTKVVVHETGTYKGKYVAEQSLDGINYTQLGVSYGKSRTVIGPSGTKVWVRFAQVRSGLQSAWSTPILVTIP
jgi:hypothetical protein